MASRLVTKIRSQGLPWAVAWSTLAATFGCGTQPGAPPVTVVAEESSPVANGASAEQATAEGTAPNAQAVAAKADELPPDLGSRKQGVDWPAFLGPTGDSKSSETGLLLPWPRTGPKLVWQRPLGESYDIGTVSRGRYFQFDREGGSARVLCLHAETGEEIWTFAYTTSYTDLYGYNGGPRCSPIVDGNRVYVLGAEGLLHCLTADQGKLVWRVDTAKDFGVVQNFFGVGSTPVIFGDLLLVMIGGSPATSQQVPPGRPDLVEPNGTGVVAFDKLTGKVRYQLGDDLASYASLKLARIDDRDWCFAFLRSGLVGFEPRSGKMDFEFSWRSRILESVNASTPVVVGNQVLISETYGPGSALLAVRPGGSDVVWSDDAKKRQKKMQCHWNTPIFVDGYLYGCSGRNPPDADLRCLEWQTGEVRWTVPNRVRTSLLYVDGHFVCLSELGDLQLIKVNPEKCEVVAQVTLQRPEAGANATDAPLLEYPCWAAPILSHGLLYLRGEHRLVCLQLMEERG